MGGELLDAVLAKGSYSEADARLCFVQLLRGVHYLHSRCATNFRPILATTGSQLSNFELSIELILYWNVSNHHMCIYIACISIVGYALERGRTFGRDHIFHRIHTELNKFININIGWVYSAVCNVQGRMPSRFEAGKSPACILRGYRAHQDCRFRPGQESNKERLLSGYRLWDSPVCGA